MPPLPTVPVPMNMIAKGKYQLLLTLSFYRDTFNNLFVINYADYFWRTIILSDAKI
jgi:hypothetical protein